LFVLKRLDHEPREDKDEMDVDAKLATGEDTGYVQVGD
jgi:hypothetical protein